mmetsp:Transcript_15004/g.34783  ORF Transcript_15004/g.34783 Transcript_15004/m.34783 type:complete len:203 (+) Transcript_15004:1160-1768(+)
MACSLLRGNFFPTFSNAALNSFTKSFSDSIQILPLIPMLANISLFGSSTQPLTPRTVTSIITVPKGGRKRALCGQMRDQIRPSLSYPIRETSLANISYTRDVSSPGMDSQENSGQRIFCVRVIFSMLSRFPVISKSERSASVVSLNPPFHPSGKLSPLRSEAAVPFAALSPRVRVDEASWSFIVNYWFVKVVVKYWFVKVLD